MVTNDDDNNNNNYYFITITCIIIYTIVLTSYIFWKKNNKKHNPEFFRSMCSRIEIMIRMIFLFRKKNRQPAYAIPAFSQHKTRLLKNNNIRPHFNLA